MTTSLPPFLDLPEVDPSVADVLLLPLPYDATACYGKGTANGPQAIWKASTHVECWDEELDWDLDSISYCTSQPVVPREGEAPHEYLERIETESRRLRQFPGLVVGVGGEHSVSVPLVAAAAPDGEDLSHLTVVQIDAHSDLRPEYLGTADSHACAMRRLLDKRANILAIGIRSADREEFRHGRASGRVKTYFSQKLATDEHHRRALQRELIDLSGDCYLTVDIDALECSLCPGTGTPQPGGLNWWEAMGYLRILLHENRELGLVGLDVVETVPQPGSRVNEFVAARVLTKALAYRFAEKKDVCGHAT